jgi:hypothetical protein
MKRSSSNRRLKAKPRGDVFRKNQPMAQAHSRPDWQSFFALTPEAPEDFLEPRGDQPPQTRDPF